MNRRTLLTGASLLALAGCGIVTSTTTNGVTTYTVDVGRADKFVQALVSGMSQIAMLPIVPLVYQTMFATITGIITTDIAALDKASGGQLVLTLDSTSLQATFNSIVTDAQSILSTIAQALPQTAMVGTVLDIVSAVKTIVLLIEAMVPSPTPVAAARASAGPMADVPKMTEAQALIILKVR